MKIHEPAMTFLNDEGKSGWNQSVEANQDPYGNAVIRYCSEWATRLETLAKETSADLSSLEKQINFMIENASKISHDANDEGITGFMYGCAVSILSKVWVYGEALRRWHNKDTQLGTEGDKANENGGVLNPALVNIG